MKKSELLEIRDNLQIKYNELDFSIGSQNVRDDDASGDLYGEADKETRPMSKEVEKYKQVKKDYDNLASNPIKSVFNSFLFDYWIDFLLCVCWTIAFYFSIRASFRSEFDFFSIFGSLMSGILLLVKPLAGLIAVGRDERFKFVLRLTYIGCIAISVVFVLVPSASVRVGAFFNVCSLLILLLLRIMEVFEKPHRLRYISDSDYLRKITDRLETDIINLKKQYEWVARMISFGCQLILFICTWLILVHFNGNPFSQ